MDPLARKFPWYRLANGPVLNQGDLLFEFSLVVPVGTLAQIQANEDPPAEVLDADVIILTQSCDLDQGKIDNVLVAPIYDADYVAGELLRATTDSQKSGKKKEIKKGRYPSLFPLPPCRIPGFAAPCRVVNFRQIAAMPLSLVQEHAEQTRRRISLQPPYREGLAQAFALFVMRVGNPQEFEME